VYKFPGGFRCLGIRGISSVLVPRFPPRRFVRVSISERFVSWGFVAFSPDSLHGAVMVLSRAVWFCRVSPTAWLRFSVYGSVDELLLGL